jgi:hypothetical protein
MVLRPDADGALRSRVLRSWSRQPDGSLRLLPDASARFSDGAALRPEDLSASLEAQGFSARVDDGAVVASKKGVGGPALEVELLFAAVFRPTAAGPIGTGPFALVEGDAAHLRLRRVVPVPGRIGEVELAAFATPRDAFARVIRGEANGIVSLDERQLELLSGIPELRPVRALGPHALAIVMNPRLDAATRRAIAAAPMREVARAAYGERCEAEMAAGAADDTGAPPALGRRVAILTGTIDPGLDRGALALRRTLGPAAGELVRADPPRFAEAQVRGAFDVALMTLLVWPRAVEWLYWSAGSPWNLLHYANPAFDAALSAGDAAGAARALQSDPPVVVLCRRERIGAFDARISNATLGTWGLLDTLPDWEVER